MMKVTKLESSTRVEFDKVDEEVSRSSIANLLRFLSTQGCGIISGEILASGGENREYRIGVINNPESINKKSTCYRAEAIPQSEDLRVKIVGSNPNENRIQMGLLNRLLTMQGIELTSVTFILPRSDDSFLSLLRGLKKRGN